MATELLTLEQDRQNRAEFNQLMQKHQNDIFVRVTTNSNGIIQGIKYTAPNTPTGANTAASKTSVANLGQYKDELLNTYGPQKAIEVIKKLIDDKEKEDAKLYQANPERRKVDRSLLIPTPPAIKTISALSALPPNPQAFEPSTETAPQLKRPTAMGKTWTTGLDPKRMFEAWQNDQASEDRMKQNELQARENYSKRGARSGPGPIPQAEMGSREFRKMQAEDANKQRRVVINQDILEAYGISSEELYKKQTPPKERYYYVPRQYYSDNEVEAFQKDINYVRTNLTDIKTFVSKSSLSADQKNVMTYFFEHIKPENSTTRESDLIEDLASFHQAYKQTPAQSQKQNPNFFGFLITSSSLSANQNSQNQNGKLAATQTFENKLKEIADIYKKSLDDQGINYKESGIALFGPATQKHRKHPEHESITIRNGEPSHKDPSLETSKITQKEIDQNRQGIFDEEQEKERLIEQIDKKFEEISKLKGYSKDKAESYKKISIKTFVEKNEWGEKTNEYYREFNRELEGQIKDITEKTRQEQLRIEKGELYEKQVQEVLAKQAAEKQRQEAEKQRQEELRLEREEAEKQRQEEAIRAPLRESQEALRKSERSKKIAEFIERQEAEELRAKQEAEARIMQEKARRAALRKMQDKELEEMQKTINRIENLPLGKPSSPPTTPPSIASEAPTVVQNLEISLNFTETDYYQLKNDIDKYNENLGIVLSYQDNIRKNPNYWNPISDKAQESIDRYHKFQTVCSSIQKNAKSIDEMDTEFKKKFKEFLKYTHELLDEDTKNSLQTTQIYKDYHKEQADYHKEQAEEQITQIQDQTKGGDHNKLSRKNLLSLAQNVIASGNRGIDTAFSELLTEKSENIDMRVLKEISKLFTDAQKTDLAEGAIKQKEIEANNKLKAIYDSPNANALNDKLQQLKLNKILTSVSDDSIKKFQDFLKTNSHLIDTKTFKSLGEQLNKAQKTVYFQDDIAITPSNLKAIDNLARFVEEKSEGFRVKDNLSYYGQLMTKTCLSSLGYNQELLKVKKPSPSPEPKGGTQPKKQSSQEQG